MPGRENRSAGRPGKLHGGWRSARYHGPTGAAVLYRVILEPLPVDRLVAGLPACRSDLDANNWHAAAHAIMTTDTVAKAASRRLEVAGRTVTVTGMSRGPA